MPGCALQYCATAARTSSFAAASALRPLGLRDRVDRFAAEIFADQILDQDRQQLGLVERGEVLAQRVVDRREHDPVLLGHVDAAGR